MTSHEIAVLFGARVDELRKDRGWTKAELSRRVSDHPSNVGRIIAGKFAPSAETIAKFATVFGVEVCELLCRPKRKSK